MVCDFCVKLLDIVFYYFDSFWCPANNRTEIITVEKHFFSRISFLRTSDINNKTIDEWFFEFWIKIVSFHMRHQKIIWDGIISIKVLKTHCLFEIDISNFFTMQICNTSATGYSEKICNNWCKWSDVSTSRYGKFNGDFRKIFFDNFYFCYCYWPFFDIKIDSFSYQVIRPFSTYMDSWIFWWELWSLILKKLYKIIIALINNWFNVYINNISFKVQWWTRYTDIYGKGICFCTLLKSRYELSTIVSCNK